MARKETMFVVGGVSTTVKGLLTLRVTNNYAARMLTFAADGDTQVVMIGLPFAMTKAAVAAALGGSEQFVGMCVAKGYDADTVRGYLKGWSDKNAVGLPTLVLDTDTDTAAAVNE